MSVKTGIEIHADGDVIELTIEQARAVAVALKLTSPGTCDAHVQFCEFCTVVHCRSDSARQIAQDFINNQPSC